MHLLEIALGTAITMWSGLGGFFLWATREIPVLEPEEETKSLPDEPRVSIIVAARDEEEVLPRFLDSVLKLDYSDYDLTIVDDDSTDRTGAIAEEWAARPEVGGRI